MATRTRSRSQTHIISTQYHQQVRSSSQKYNGPHLCWLTEVIKQKNPRANCPKMMDAKYAKIRDLINRGTFRAVLRIELHECENMITTRYVLRIKSNEDKEERYKAIYVASGTPRHNERLLSTWGTNHPVCIRMNGIDNCQSQKIPLVGFRCQSCLPSVGQTAHYEKYP